MVRGDDAFSEVRPFPLDKVREALCRAMGVHRYILEPNDPKAASEYLKALGLGDE